MPGVAVTWDQTELQVIDEEDFEEVVVDVVDDFFEAIDGHSQVTVDWRTPTRNHSSVYKVSSPPLVHLDRSRCFIDIVGEQRGGAYKLDLKPSGFEIITRSSGQREELTFLQLRGPGIAIDPQQKELFLDRIPRQIRERIIDPLRD